MDEAFTQNQRVAVEAMEGARRAGVPLSDYAKAKGLEVRPVYDAIAALRRRGALAPPERAPQRKPRRKKKSKFVAVQVRSSPAPFGEVGRGTRSNLVCRLVRTEGGAIECSEWPEPKWVAAVLASRRDAAT
jgi:hypothetical protein